MYSRQLIKQKSMSAASSAAGAAMLAGSNGTARSYTDLAGKSPQQQVYQSGGGGGVLYNLRAVIVHSGGIHSGFNNMGYILLPVPLEFSSSGNEPSGI